MGPGGGVGALALLSFTLLSFNLLSLNLLSLNPLSPPVCRRSENHARNRHPRADTDDGRGRPLAKDRGGTGGRVVRAPAFTHETETPLIDFVRSVDAVGAR
ncbi:hypothetical protein GCM10009603_51140 [Nocardiopsis exhalans]